MSWDADTLPLRHIDMFDEFGKPIFDTKAELMPGYFYTIQKLFGFNKVKLSLLLFFEVLLILILKFELHLDLLHLQNKSLA